MSSTTSESRPITPAAGTRLRSCYRRSSELSERAGDVVNVARAQNNEGEIVSDQGKLEEAEALFLEARRVWRAARYPVGIALATSNLGRVAARATRFDEALELLAEALVLFESLGSEALVHETEARRAECLVLAGRFQEALDVAPTVLEAAEENPLLYPFLERLHGYALVQARQAGRRHARASSGASSWHASSRPTTRWR